MLRFCAELVCTFVGTDRKRTMKELLILFILISPFSILAQEESEAKELQEAQTSKSPETKFTVGDRKDSSYTEVEIHPEFPGGEKGMFMFLGEQTRYPEAAKKLGIQGVVYLTFIVEKDGSTSNAEVLRGIGGGCDEEALRVVRMMPKWRPGKHKGETVRVQYNLPFRFVLTGRKRGKKKKRRG